MQSVVPTLRTFRNAATLLVLGAALFLPAACSSAEEPAAPADEAAAPTEDAAMASPEVVVEPTAEMPEPTSADAGSGATTGGAAAAIAKLNLNTATDEEFRTIPNVGDQMVDEFNEYRPFTSIEQFRREIGKYVDEAQVAEYEMYLFVPIDPNNADAATLQQIPGVDAEIAEALIAGRPYSDNAAFVAAVLAQAGPEAAAVAERFAE